MSTATVKTTATEELCECAVDMKETLKDMAGLAPEAAREQFQHARECVHNKVEQGKEKAACVKHGVEEYIRQRPIQTVMIAAGAGLLLGLLISRKR